MKHVLVYKIRQAVAWLHRQPGFISLNRRFPRLFAFIEARFSTVSLAGLPLTLLLLVYLVHLALLSEIAEDVIDSEGIVVVDQQFTMLLYEDRSIWLSKTLFFFTQLGSRLSTYIVGGLLTGFALYKKQYVVIVAFWLTMAGVGLSVQYGKKYIGRSRPAAVGYYSEHNYSFPSGHATTAISQYGIVAYFMFSLSGVRWKRRLALWLCIGLIAIIGFSRIYLGVHFLSDVIAGFLLGGMWLLLGISLIEIINNQSNRLTSV